MMNEKEKLDEESLEMIDKDLSLSNSTELEVKYRWLVLCI